jgi:oligopeptidase B
LGKKGSAFSFIGGAFSVLCLYFGTIAINMKRIISLVALLIMGHAQINAQLANSTKRPIMNTPPVAQKIPFEVKGNNEARIDNYYWMRLSDDQKNAPAEKRDSQTEQVLAYLEQENAYTASAMSKNRQLMADLFDEMKGRIKESDQSVPTFINQYWYYTRFEKGQDYPYYCRKHLSMEEGKEEILIDGPAMAAGKDYWSLASYNVNEENRIMAYGIDEVSRRIYTIFFKNISSGKVLEDKLEGTTGSVAWANDNKTVFYTKKDPQTLREYQVWRHEIGQPQSADVLVYTEQDEEFHCFVYKTKSKDFIFIGSSQTQSTEYRYISANDPKSEFKVILKREKNHEYSVDHYGDQFFIVTNWEATNFRLVTAPIGNSDKSAWKELIPHRKDVLLEGITIFRDYLVVEERKNGLTQIQVKNWSGEQAYYLEFNDPAYAAGVGANPEFNTTLLRFSYSSMTTPSSTYEMDMKSKTKKLLKQQEVLGDFDPANYVSERIFATSKDGTQVPISLVYKKGFERNGSAPLLLYGYGSYGYSLDATFSSTRLSLLDRGFVFAIAHIRGGQEMGREWYEQGKLLNKMNTFYDFIACGNFLVEEKYAASDKLFAMGGSAGGLLMGAVTNMAPEMWKGIVSSVPFVDVVTTMLDETIPLTTFEFDEWGNPKNPEYYNYMLSYSPYDNIEYKEYPNILVTTGYWDSQVQYWEPAKYVAKLREMKKDNNLLLLHTNMDAGHGGKSGRFEYLKEIALEYAFILDLAGIKK